MNSHRQRALGLAGFVWAVVAFIVAYFFVPWSGDGARPTAADRRLATMAGSKVTAGSDIRAGDLGSLPDVMPAPPYRPPAVDDARLAAFVNREATSQRVFDDMAARFPQLTSARDIAAVAGVLKDPADDDTVRHEAAALLARSGYPGLVADLLGILNNPAEGERFRGWAVQHVQQNYAVADAKTQAAILAQLRTSLADRHQPVRRESLLALHRLLPAEGLAVARAWLHATAAGADAGRDLAIRVIREQDARDELAAVRQYARHPEPALRIAALVTLAAWKDEASRDAMADAAASADPRLRRCGERALAQFAATPTARDAQPE